MHTYRIKFTYNFFLQASDGTLQNNRGDTEATKAGSVGSSQKALCGRGINKHDPERYWFGF
jgi:hypothetical protein